MFEGKKVLITGGSGSLGRALTKRLLEENVHSIRIFSRNEFKQIEMQNEFDNDPRLRFLIGDIRDRDRLFRAMEGTNIVFHAAALKHVPVVEYNPFEAIRTNVVGSQNVIDASHRENVELSIAIGTDKAVSPVNVYGATKLLTEKLFVSAHNYVDPKKYQTKFLALRYGNVLGSSGSVLPLFINQIQNHKKITITHPEMTRFTIMMDDALDFILSSVKEAKGTETFVPKLKAYNIMDLKDAIISLIGESEFEITKIRSGERTNEILMNKTEMSYSLSNEKKFILFQPEQFTTQSKLYTNYSTIDDPYEYSSDVSERLSIKELKELIKKSGLIDSLKNNN
tara:strand:- start:5711 stop:6727 length:1017 start_codon:yes stop_codon:yes gene_type:complete